MSDSGPEPRQAAIEQLEQFGMSTYAARTYVALVGLGRGTAKDVSRVSEAPRTRVYDAVDELRDAGLVDVMQASPKEFQPISAETASRKFEQEMEHRTAVLRDALADLEPVRRRDEQRGVWTVESQAAVTERVVDFIDDAEEEVVYMTVADLLTDEVLEALGEADGRGVTVKLGGSSAAVEDRIEAVAPGAELFESLWAWSDTPAGRLMMVDRELTLVSALLTGQDGSPRSETAIWGTGEANSLVVVLRAVFTWRLEEPSWE